MKMNVGGIDRIARIVLGLILLSLVVLLEGGGRWLALIGFVPLLTALVGYCPLYTVLKVSTCAANTAVH